VKFKHFKIENTSFNLVPVSIFYKNIHFSSIEIASFSNRCYHKVSEEIKTNEQNILRNQMMPVETKRNARIDVELPREIEMRH